MVQRLSRLPLSAKILVMGLGLTVSFPILFLAWLFPDQKSNAYRMQAGATQHMVEAAWGVLNYYGLQVSNGRMTMEQAQSAAKETIRQARYEGSNYIWINDLRPVIILHPANIALEGKDVSDYRDPNGVAIFVEAARIGRDVGAGVLRYMWPKPGQSKPAPKISFVKLYAPWGWVLGTGIYVDDTEATLNHERNFVFVLTVIDLIASALLCFLAARTIVTPIRRATGDLNQVAQDTNNAANQVASASKEIASRVSVQAAAMEETCSSVEELRAECLNGSGNAKRIRDVVAVVHGAVDAGNRHMSDMNEAIEQIGHSARNVRSIVETIDDVAFQTNILALNAAVEAARAGQAGAGFSVVADEVRNLAQRASQAAHETAQIIGDSLASSQRGIAISAKLSEALSQILDRIAEVLTSADRIVESFEKQNERVSQINSAVSQLTDSTQSQAASSEQTASAAAELHAHAASLRTLTRELHQTVLGS